VICLVPLAEEHQSTRLHIHKPEYDPERINLILMIALLLAVGAAIFYLGMSFSLPLHRAAFPVSAW
jgi:hypothetical protein